MRPLNLHVSALNDAEYQLYIDSLTDLACPDDYNPAVHYDDAYYEALSVGAREARAWLRGRFASLPVSTVDSILRLFSPSLAHSDVLTGGQFFAVLRLIIHAIAGKPVDSSLVFIQAYPTQGTQSQSTAQSKPTTPPQRNSQVITSDILLPDLNPLVPISVPDQPVYTTQPPPPNIPPKPTNPFLNRRISQDVSRPVIPGADVSSARPRQSISLDGRLPPLPPRKSHPPPPPPRHSSLIPANHYASLGAANTPNLLIQQSLQATRVAQSLKKAEQRLENERVMEVLKSSNNQGARASRSSSPNKDSPGSVSSTSASSSVERPPPPRVPTLPPRPRVSPPASSAGTSRSLESVAHAAVYKHTSPFSHLADHGRPTQLTRSPSHTPPRPLAELPSEPPPTHPDRRPSLSASEPERAPPDSPRVFRSRSMHHHPTPPPVPPPLARRRPESVQLSPSTPSTDSFSSALGSPARSQFSSGASSTGSTLSRHMSLSGRARTDGPGTGADTPTPMATLQKTFSTLQLKAQPRLDSARYKAEAGLTRRGFVQHGRETPRWMRADGEEGLLGGAGADEGLGTDEDSVEQDTEGEAEWERRVRRLRDGEPANGSGDDGRWRAPRMEVDRDELKWPAGEGWKPL